MRTVSTHRSAPELRSLRWGLQGRAVMLPMCTCIPRHARWRPIAKESHSRNPHPSLLPTHLSRQRGEMTHRKGGKRAWEPRLPHLSDPPESWSSWLHSLGPAPARRNHSSPKATFPFHSAHCQPLAKRTDRADLPSSRCTARTCGPSYCCKAMEL